MSTIYEHEFPQWLMPSSSFAISDKTADLLRTKQLVGIWCHADQWFDAHKLSGFYTGMFVSELHEAQVMGVRDATLDHVNESNRVFAEIAGRHAASDTCAMQIAIMTEYAALCGSNPVARYNLRQMEAARAIAEKHATELPPMPERKTLVVHPKDSTTDFLKPIYKRYPDWTVVSGDVTPERLNELIAEHDRILMMGHGSQNGLFAIGQFWKRFLRPTHAPLNFPPAQTVSPRKDTNMGVSMRKPAYSTTNFLHLDTHALGTSTTADVHYTMAYHSLALAGEPADIEIVIDAVELFGTRIPGNKLPPEARDYLIREVRICEALD